MSTGREARSDGSATARVLGLDSARAVAVAGMIAVNVGPKPEDIDGDGFWLRLYELPHGRASLLFVLLAGVGVSLLTRGVRGGAQSGAFSRGVAGAWTTLLWRALLLLLMGLGLQLLDHDVNVILAVYAVLFVLGGLLMRAPDGVLLAGSSLSLLLGPPLWLALRDEEVAEPDLLTPPPALLDELFVSGPYPVITWAAPFLFGMWLGRRGLAERDVQIRMILWGTGVTVVSTLGSSVGTSMFYDADAPVGPTVLLTSVAHSQMPLWLLSGTASAVAVAGVMLFVTPRLPRLTWPLVATGQLALTVYVGHLVALTFIRPAPYSAAQGALLSACLVLGSVLVATSWRAVFARGPLESLLRLPGAVRARRTTSV